MSGDMLFFSVGTIGLSTRGGRKPSTLLGAARHNQRAIQAERGGRRHIDVARSHWNETIAGPATPEGVVELAQGLITAAGVDATKLRKDHAQAVELLFSLPPDTAIDTSDYFAKCLGWATKRFGQANILSACIHRDEAAPHCHILISPMVNGRMRGSSLVTRPALVELSKSFFKVVAQSFGLQEPVRMSGAERGQAARLVLARLESSQDAVLQSRLWQTVRQDIEHAPARYVAVLGLELPVVKPAPKKPQRTVVQIFTSKGKGAREDKPIALEAPVKGKAKKSAKLAHLKPIGIDDETENYGGGHRNLSCVGFDGKSDGFHSASGVVQSQPITVTTASQASTTRQQFVDVGALVEMRDSAGDGDSVMTREREDDHEARHSSEELGNFIQSTTLTAGCAVAQL